MLVSSDSDTEALTVADSTAPSPALESPARRRASAGWIADALCLIALAAAGAVLASKLNYRAHPLEDAAMLMRYAVNLAHGHGLVWNVGAQPVDGATDFLFTVVLAIPITAGADAVTATRALVIAAIFLTGGLTFVVARRVQHSGRMVAVGAAALVIVGPGFRLAEAGFGAPFFGLSVAMAWGGAWWYREQPTSRARAAIFAGACLVMALVRPEGVLLAVFIVTALLVNLGPRRCRVLLGPLLVVAVLGATYFAWRWNYFGYPLPNPYYKKGGGTLHEEGLRAAFDHAMTLGRPFLIMAGLALLPRSTRALAVFALIPFVGFTLLWVLISDEMNYLGRFQYPLLVLGAMSFAPVAVAINREVFNGALARGNARAVIGGGLAVIAFFTMNARLEAFNHETLVRFDGRYDTGRVLERYRNRGYTLVTTEAGLLPLVSGWRTIDAWGLNDPTIAHHGLHASYLDAHPPDVVMTHAAYLPGRSQPTHDGIPGWNTMTRKLDRYATRRGFIHAAAFGTPTETWNFYVRPENPDACQLVRGVRAVKFMALGSAAPLPNLLTSTAC